MNGAFDFIIILFYFNKKHFSCNENGGNTKNYLCPVPVLCVVYHTNIDMIIG